MDKLLAEAKLGTYKGRKIGKMDKSDLMKALYTEAGEKEYIDPQKQKWIDAEKHLKNIRQIYVDEDVDGLEMLTKTINPLLVGLMSGNKTDELYKKIMSLE